MIDFQKSAVFKLSPIPVEKTFAPIQKFLIVEEQVFVGVSNRARLVSLHKQTHHCR